MSDRKIIEANVEVRHNSNPDYGPVGPMGFTASLSIAATISNADIRGAPMGRGDTRDAALRDLERRIRDESGVIVTAVDTAAPPVIEVNGERFVAHTRENDPPELRIWREADDLIKAGRIAEAHALIKSKIGPDDEVPDGTLVIRVVLAIERYEASLR